MRGQHRPWRPAAGVPRYLMRSLMDGSPAAAAMFDQTVQVTERWLAKRKVECADLRACAAVLVAMQMGVFLMPGALSRALGVEASTTEGQVRINRAFVDLFSQRQLSPDEAREAHAALDRLQPPPPPTAPQTGRE